MALSKARWINLRSSFKKCCRIESRIKRVRAKKDFAAHALELVSLLQRLAIHMTALKYLVSMYEINRETIQKEFENAQKAVRKEERKKNARRKKA